MYSPRSPRAMSPRAMSPRLMQTQNINTMGMDQDQMVKEARYRMAENKKRAQLRNLRPAHSGWASE